MRRSDLQISVSFEIRESGDVSNIEAELRQQ